MASEDRLPTWPEIRNGALRDLDTARSAMSGVRDWLKTDSRPGSGPSDADVRREVLRLVGEVKDRIDQAKGLLYG